MRIQVGFHSNFPPKSRLVALCSDGLFQSQNDQEASAVFREVAAAEGVLDEETWWLEMSLKKSFGLLWDLWSFRFWGRPWPSHLLGPVNWWVFSCSPLKFKGSIVASESFFAAAKESRILGFCCCTGLIHFQHFPMFCSQWTCAFGIATTKLWQKQKQPGYAALETKVAKALDAAGGGVASNNKVPVGFSMDSDRTMEEWVGIFVRLSNGRCSMIVTWFNSNPRGYAHFKIGKALQKFRIF